MKRLALILSIVLLVGCSPKGSAPGGASGSVQTTGDLPVIPVILEVPGNSVRPGGTVVLEAGPHEFTLRFSKPVDARSIQIRLDPTVFQVRPNRDQPDPASFRFSLELTGKQPDDASVLLLSAKGRNGKFLVLERQEYHLKFSPAKPNPAPKERVQPSVTVWAVDPTGERTPEVVFSRPDPLVLLGVSPDGRYWLFERMMGEVQGSPGRLPYLYDRLTGRLLEGARVEMLPTAVAWSGKGFWVNWLVHLNLDLSVDTYPRLREALGLTGKKLLAASFTPDGGMVAILAMPIEATTGLTADLILANSDGTGVRRVSGVVQPWWGKAGYFAYLSLSPSGDRAILLSQVPGDALIDTARLAREQWKPLISPFAEVGSPDRLESGPPGYSVWAPSGRHVWLPGSSILSREGEVVTRLPDTSPWAVWNGDGAALITGARPGTKALRLVTLDGHIREFELPDWGIPVDFLPDGRVLVYRTTFSD